VTAVLAEFLDAHGHRVTATTARGDLLVILTSTAESGLRDGHPCVNRAQAAELRDALTTFIDGGAL